MMTQLNRYVSKFKALRSDRNAQWPVTALNRSPYKPLLLLAVIDLFTQGSIAANLIELTPDLSELFSLYCSLILSPDRRFNIAMPFFHLSREGFWHLVPWSGKEAVVASGRLLRSVSLLTDTVKGARLDEELYRLMCTDEARNGLRLVLVETYFAPTVRQRLMEQGLVNSEAFEYSQLLLDLDLQKAKETRTTGRDYDQLVRNQGFRRAVVTAYDHRCALCGIRMLTPDGHTAVTAAHIIPWSVTHNDDPRNGLALCRLCHWTFDEGLVGISPRYIVRASPQLASRRNVPGYLATLNGRGIIGPLEQALWPEPYSLKWHLREVFLRR